MKPFGLAKNQLRTFSDPLLEYLPASFDREAVADSEYEDLESLAQLALSAVVTERIAKLQTDQVGVDQMTEKLLFNDGQRALVSGFRFLNLDLKLPFIALKANFRVNESETIRLLKTLVMKTYGDADPLGFTIWEQPGLDLGESGIWSIVVAGDSEVEAAESSTRLELCWPATVEDFYADLKREYAQWSLLHPDVSRFVRPTNQGDLEAAAARGHLLAVYDHRGFAGVIAGRSFPLFGKEALYLTELFLVQRIRGQGLGKWLQAQFLEKMKNEFDVVWGHINSNNKPSLQTALKLGRTPLQQEYFFTLSSD